MAIAVPQHEEYHGEFERIKKPIQYSIPAHIFQVVGRVCCRGLLARIPVGPGVWTMEVPRATIPCNRWPSLPCPAGLGALLSPPSPVPPKSNLSDRPLGVPYVFLSPPLPIITTIIGT